MRCLRHQDREAVGVCYHCGCGICADCVTPVEGILSCPDHTVQTAGMASLLRHNVANHVNGSWAPPLAYLLIGLGGLAGGAFMEAERLTGGWIIAVLGGGSLLMFIANVAGRWKRRKPE